MQMTFAAQEIVRRHENGNTESMDSHRGRSYGKTSYWEALEQELASTRSELRVAEELVAQERLKNRQSTERDMVESQCH